MGITVDKFHVGKNIQDAVENVRCREMRSRNKKKYSVLAKTKYLWLKKSENFTAKSSAAGLRNCRLWSIWIRQLHMISDFVRSISTTTHHECDE